MFVMCKYKPLLKEFDYPNINGLGDEQFQDIFSPENRFFLLTWILKKLYSHFIVPTEWSKPTEILYANIFEESGFCRSAQKLSFVKGDLSNQEQIQIFDSIFKYLQFDLQKENIEPNPYTNDMYSTSLFLKEDFNLFPTLGPIKLRTEQQRDQKLKYYQEEIEKLRKEIVNFEFDREDDFSFANSGYDAEELEKNIDKFKTQAKKLQEVSGVIGKIDQNKEDLTQIGFKPDFDEDLISCNSEVNMVLQYFKNVNLMTTVNSKELQELQSFEQKQLASVVQQHIESSSDVAKAMKNISNSV